MMYVLARLAFFVAAVLVCGTSFVGVQAQSANAGGAKGSPGSISGRVQISGKGAPGVLVVAHLNQSTAQPVADLKTRTDEDGRFRLSGVMAGPYTVAPVAPVFVNPNQDVTGQSGKSVTVSAGEAVEGIDFTLVRGGVITGRVTDADGRPVIARYVRLTVVDERGQRRALPEYQSQLSETDDRGVYRVYGLPAGRYLVSYGVEERSYEREVSDSNFYYVRTFHPDVTDESKAEAVEVSEGSEATGIDIRLGRPLPLYRATGRIVDAQSGKPVPGINYFYSVVFPQADASASFSQGNPSNSLGEFRIEGLMPGRYAVLTDHQDETDWYSDPVFFEVTDRDISGLEMKLHRGASITGVAVVEGVDDKAVLAKLSQMQITATGEIQEQLGQPSYSLAVVAADGHFRLKGLRPGKVTIHIPTYFRQGFSLLRVERDGVEQREGIEIAAGEQMTGVRVVLGYGTGVVRGQIKIEGGRLPEDLRLFVRARPVDGRTQNGKFVEADARGRFLIEGLMAGDYELILSGGYVGEHAESTRPPAMPPKQTVTVTNGVEAEATFVLNLNAKETP